MKFTFIPFFALSALIFLSVSKADEQGERQLRFGKKGKGKNKPTPAPTPEPHYYQGVTIQVGHVDSQGTVDDQALALALIQAYNEIHNNWGTEIHELFISTEVQIPEDPHTGALVVEGDQRKLQNGWSYWTWLSVWGFLDWSCRYCLEDDDWGYRHSYNGGSHWLPPLAGYAQSSNDMHKSFEAKFCSNLKKAGYAFSDANECKVEFTYSAASFEDAVLVSKKPTTENFRLGSQITLEHVDGTQQQDLAAESDALTTALLEAYNTVHTGVEHKMTSANLLRMLDEKANGSSFFNRHIWFDITSTDQEVLPPIDELFTDNITHKAFERMFCAKLKGTGLPTFQSLMDCSISFSYSAVEDDDQPTGGVGAAARVA